MVAPGKWLDHGPAEARPTASNFAVRAFTGADMMPVLKGGATSTKGAEVNARRRAERVRGVRKERPACGVIMQFVGQPCGRKPGHRDSHRSRASMDADMRSRWGHP